MNSFYVACFFIIIINFPFSFSFADIEVLRERERQREEGRKRRRQSRRRWKKEEKMKGVKTVRKNNQRQCWGGCISSWWYHLGVWPLSQDILPFPRHELPIFKKNRTRFPVCLTQYRVPIWPSISLSWIFLSRAKPHYPVTISPRLVWMWSPLLCWIGNS